MKTCVSCKFKKEESFQMPDGRYQMMFICHHEECIDPVVGEPVPCNVARRDPVFCGVNARYYIKLEEKPKQEKNVIEIAKS